MLLPERRVGEETMSKQLKNSIYPGVSIRHYSSYANEVFDIMYETFYGIEPCEEIDGAVCLYKFYGEINNE